ncbi:hypothetical protein [Halogranum rubrum]|uniref:Uncharacterized protein n=1 Tax=Halogranum salarium B-1 TaxID=1210908 RepID=J2ZZS9_9EURY|nr:hypothetical protein [Halogranum salarium]EJN58553.1 hypothetical protein HSB1_30310 [Halogranum salarium B-1]
MNISIVSLPANPPDGWQSFSTERGSRYSAAQRVRFVNPNAGLAVAVTLDDDGPEYRVDRLCDGDWTPVVRKAPRDEALRYAHGFMRTTRTTN